MIYFIQQNPEENGPVKIGVSNDPGRRLDTLQTGSPHDLDLVYSACVSDDQECESILHTHFKSKRLNGEWFDIGLLFDRKHPATIIGNLPIQAVFEECIFCGDGVYPEMGTRKWRDDFRCFYQCAYCKVRTKNERNSDEAASRWNEMMQSMKS